MKKILIILFLTIFIVTGCSNNKSSNEGINQDIRAHDNYNVDEFPKEYLSDEELIALNLTLNDEYRAEAIYQKVINKFGEVRPFVNIINAEVKHSDAIIQLYNKYNLTVPVNDWYNKVPEFNSVAEACSAGVDAEIENAALYDKLLSPIDNKDIITVFISLRDASINNHLPAFQRCSEK